MTLICEAPPVAAVPPPRDSLPEPEEAQEILDAMKRAETFPDYCSLRNRLLLAHMPLVRRLARRFARNLSEQNDLESDGAHEMLGAIARFKPESGAPFRAYAFVCVRGRMLNTLSQTEGMGIAGNAARNLRRLRATLAANGDSSPSMGPKTLAEASGIPQRAIRRLRPFIDRVSLDAQAVAAEGRSAPIAEIARVDPIFGDEPNDAAGCLQLSEDLTILGRSLQQLPWKERFVLGRLYGLGGRPPLSQTDLAGVMGISRQRVGQITARALKHLKASGWRLD